MNWRLAGPASGVSPSGRAVRPAAGVNLLTVANALLAFYPPRVSHGQRWARLRRSSSHALGPRAGSSPAGSGPKAFTKRLPNSLPWAAECRSIGRVAGLPSLARQETAVLPGFSSLVTLPALEGLARPWLIVSPRIPERVTASRRTLFGLCLPRPEQGRKNAAGSVSATRFPRISMLKGRSP
jgi:hypothetical protein